MKHSLQPLAAAVAVQQIMYDQGSERTSIEKNLGTKEDFTNISAFYYK